MNAENNDPNRLAPPQSSCSAWLAAINVELDARIEEMKQEMNRVDQPSQKNALGTAIITVNAIAWAISDARKKMAANGEVSEGGTRDSRIETAAQSRPSLH